MTSYRPYKFLIVPVAQELDDADNVTGEASPKQPDIVFGVDGLHRYADEFETILAAHLAAAANGGRPA